MDSKPTPSQYADLAVLRRTPEYWLSAYMEDGGRGSLYSELMECLVFTRDIPRVLRCLPENLLSDFVQNISRVAAFEKEEDFIKFGYQWRWGVKEARQVMHWLAEHPHPELAPPDGKPEPDPNWEPPETEYRREFRRLVERRRLFYAKMLDYVAHTQDIPGVLRLLPEDMLSDFVHHIEWVAEKESEEELIKVADNVHMRLREARQTKKWLAEHPHPQLAPRGVTLEFALATSWDPLGTENERALHQMLEQCQPRCAP